MTVTLPQVLKKKRLPQTIPNLGRGKDLLVEIRFYSKKKNKFDTSDDDDGFELFRKGEKKMENTQQISGVFQ